MPSKLLSLLLALVGLAEAEKLAADCTDSLDKSCLHTGCCTIPGTKCYRKNKKWAACRKECTPGPHYNEPPFDKKPWDCIELTGGCNAMHKPCGVWEGYKGTPCCEWGCSCNKTKWGFACVPTKNSGEYTCNKQDEETYDDKAPENFDARQIANLPGAPGGTAGLRLAGLVGLAAVAAAVAAGTAMRVGRRRRESRCQSLAAERDAEVSELPE